MPTAFICSTCGTQHAESAEPPARCAICADARQWEPEGGAQWTTLEALRRRHRNFYRHFEPALMAIGTTPDFAIGQRAFLVRTPQGNVLWDCLTLLDDATLEIVRALGGIRAVAVSHPHYYTTMVEWARAFDATVYVHAADREWVMRADPALELWERETLPLGDGITLVRCGGHFPGGTVLHWAGGAEGRGALLSGDVLQVAPDRRHVSLMYSYPNMTPLPADAVRQVARAIEPLAYDRIYGAFWDREILSDAKGAVARSMARYLAAIGAIDASGRTDVWTPGAPVRETGPRLVR